MKTNREIIESAIKNNTKVSFLTNSYFEKNVEIVGYNTDDMENRDFQYKVKNGDVYTRFENNVIFKCDNQ
jgi:hypothetical protein